MQIADIGGPEESRPWQFFCLSDQASFVAGNELFVGGGAAQI
jgi:hypothetical protein